jgi:hypothetical protein
MFSEPQLSVEAYRPIAADLGVTLSILDPLGGGPGRASYVDLMLFNGRQVTFGALLGGHLFAGDPARLMPFLIATIASGLGLMALELASTCAWLFMGKAWPSCTRSRCS